MESKKLITRLTRGRKDNAHKKVFNNASRLVTGAPQNFASSRFYLNYEIKVERQIAPTLH